MRTPRPRAVYVIPDSDTRYVLTVLSAVAHFYCKNTPVLCRPETLRTQQRTRNSRNTESQSNRTGRAGGTAHASPSTLTDRTLTVVQRAESVTLSLAPRRGHGRRAYAHCIYTRESPDRRNRGTSATTIYVAHETSKS